jgi:hypothetical protein
MILPSVKKQIVLMMAGLAVSGESDVEVTFLTSSALVTGKVPNMDEIENKGIDPSLLAIMAAKDAVDTKTVIEALNGLDVEELINSNHLKETSDFNADRSRGRGKPFWDVRLERSEADGNNSETPANDGFITLQDVKVRSLCGDKTYSFPSFTLFFDQIAGVTLEVKS